MRAGCGHSKERHYSVELQSKFTFLEAVNSTVFKTQDGLNKIHLWNEYNFQSNMFAVFRGMGTS